MCTLNPNASLRYPSKMHSMLKISMFNFLLKMPEFMLDSMYADEGNVSADFGEAICTFILGLTFMLTIYTSPQA